MCYSDCYVFPRLKPLVPRLRSYPEYTLLQEGHSARVCQNECLFYRKRHNGDICPRFPGLSRGPTYESQAGGLENIYEIIAQAEQELQSVREEGRIA